MSESTLAKGIEKILSECVQNELLACIHVFSSCDDVVNFKILVPRNRKNDALKALCEASNRYGDETDEHYYDWCSGDYIEDALQRVINGEYVIMYGTDFGDDVPDIFDNIPVDEFLDF